MESRNKYDLSGEYGIGYTTSGIPFKFDKEDYDVISKHTWVVDKWVDKSGRESIYLACTINRKKYRLHRFLLNVTDPKIQVDHINHDTLDYRRCNLRLCTNKENNRNKGITKNNNSGIVGVHRDKKSNKWTAQITVDYKTINLGLFDNLTDAIKARKAAEIEYFGKFSYGCDKMNSYKIRDYQQDAVERMHNGCILNTSTGSGKSFMALLYYWTKVCGGVYTDDDYMPMTEPRPLLIITTPKKRDDHEWDIDMAPFLLSSCDDSNVYKDVAPVTVDSWNNIKKYTNLIGYFVIFDENCLSSWGTWTKSFLKIAKKNRWILLTATAGDNWSDWCPVFIANGYFKNKTEFREKHVEMNPFTRYPSIKCYHNEGKLLRYRKEILVNVRIDKQTEQHHENIICEYDKELEDICLKKRWNPFEDRPLRDATEMAVVMRRVSFGSFDRVTKSLEIIEHHPHTIIFYDYDFELQMLREMCISNGLTFSEWNGHNHEPIPDSDEWVYLVQYIAGNSAWNCTACDTMIFFNNNYSYKKMVQAAGRIDRLNTPHKHLYYYHLTSKSYIDKRVSMALKQKKKFNELRDFRQYFD